MLDASFLKRLAHDITPSDVEKLRLRVKIQERIAPAALMKSAHGVAPSRAVRMSLKKRVLAAIQGSPVSEDLRELSGSMLPSEAQAFSLKNIILGRLALRTETSFFHGTIKWSAAFAVFVLLLRAMPLVFLAPATQADVGVQLLPTGNDVSVFVGGMWRDISGPEVVKGSLMVRTGRESQVTIILNDDGVVRLQPNTTFKLHDIADRPQPSVTSPTATLIRGQIWVLGLLSPVLSSISIETAQGETEINSGSAAISEDDGSMVVAVYDRGVTFRHRNQTSFIISGEKGVTNGTEALAIVTMPSQVFTESFVSENLKQDAVHRAEIGKLQQERRERMAGILPTSILYSAKRIAEEVDLLFTLTHDGRAEKRIRQADTRLSEALSLVKDGQSDEAAVPLSEYRDSLITMAGGTGDNLVKYLIKKQIADASVSIVPETSSGEIQLVRSAVLDVSAAIPDTALQSKDIEGYVLVDKLTDINHSLSTLHDLTGALLAYADVSPYLKSLLNDKDGTHPLLQKEAKSLLVSTSALLKKESESSHGKIIAAALTDLDQYLPPEQESLLVSEAKLDEIVAGILQRIFIFKAPLSRYNQLIVEMFELRGNPNRGTLLRRLYRALPENGIGGYVLTEIKNYGDELKAK